MKKRFLAGVMMAVISVSMVACGNNVSTKENDSDTKTVTEDKTLDTDEEDADNEESDEQDSEEKLEEKAGNASEALYNAFIENDAQLYAGKQFIYGYYDYENDKSIPLLEDGKGYTLIDFFERIAKCVDEEYDSMEIDSVEYAFIDCGNDGEPELALQIGLNSDNMGYITQGYVIKNFDGKLQLCTKIESAYRSEEYFKNKYGVIYSGGSNGASSWTEGYSYINAAGENVFLYSADCEYGLGMYFDTLGGVYSVAAKYEEDIDDEWYMMEYHFDDPSDIDFENIEYDDYLKTLPYTAYPEGEELIEKIFDEAGVKLYPQKQMDDMILQDMSSKGLSKEIFDSEETVEWMKITNDTIDEVIKYGVNPVYVSTTEEFVEALSDNANIVLMPGTYNVTEYILENQKDIPYNIPNGEKEPGVYYTGDALEPGFMIYGYANLKISSQDENNMAEIVSEPRFELVVDFNNCYNVTVNNIIMGHTPEQGSCGGDVIGFTDCDTAKVRGCDLYGCGAYGTCVMDSMYINFTDTTIHDCSYGCAEIYDSTTVSFDGCRFIDCEDSTMFYNFGSYMSFYDCEFKNLRGDMLWMDDGGSTTFSGCTFDASALDSLNSYDGAGELNIY